MRFIAWIIVLCLAVTAPPASAEWFADVYGGQSLTEKNDLTVHDSAGLGPKLPTAMLFVASKDGISHNPAEFSRVEDIALAAKIVLDAVTG